MSSSNNSIGHDDSLSAPIPRKKRSSHGSSSAVNIGATSDSMDMPIPRKSSATTKRPFANQREGPQPQTGTRRRESKPLSSKGSRHSSREESLTESSLVSIVSESPLVVRIKAAVDIFPKQRSTQRQHTKRIRPMYQEMDLTDSDDFLTDDDAPPKKKGRLLPFSAMQGSKSSKSAKEPMETGVHAELPVQSDGMTPPEGTLSTLWYSREIFAQVFVLEKVLGYKTRPLITLKASSPAEEAGASSTADMDFTLDAIAASHLQQAILQDESIWSDNHVRVEISRLVPNHCPAILLAASLREAAAAKREGRQPKFTLCVSQGQEEEVLLVKWRGRSYMHCSWERASDIQRLDTSNNSTARNKIRRYYQAQETALGPKWKTMIQAQIRQDANSESAEGEEYFLLQFLEIERIHACDETEMNLDVLAKQRGRNLLREQQSLQRRDEAQQGTTNPSHENAIDPAHTQSLNRNPAIPAVYESFKKLLLDQGSILDAVSLGPDDIPWDPEDNVRYVVKWKGLPYAEITWEYWRDIKLDAVNLAEDFWYRQKAPINFQNKQHPHVRDFKKLQESPTFGLSDRSRPSIGFDEAEKDEDAFKGFKLRAYQLEGVNWLLFNWWNKRSCILAVRNPTLFSFYFFLVSRRFSN